MTTTTTRTTAEGEDTEPEISGAPHVLEACPWLLIHHGNEKQLQTFYSASKRCCYTREIPELRNTDICNSSSNGWLVVADELESDKFSLFNPFSREKIQLPPVACDYKMCLLSSMPIDHDCVVLFICENRLLKYLKLGAKHQKFQDYSVKGGSLLCATAFEGKVYVLLPEFHLAHIDFSGPKPRLVEVVKDWAIDDSVQPLVTNMKSYLVESCGELLLVKKLYRGLFCREFFGFSIFRADLQGKKWVQVRDIGQQRAIFLDTEQGLSFATTTLLQEESVKGNSIYFIEPKNRHLYVFDLEDQRVFTCLPSSHVSRRHSRRRWLMMPPN